VARRGSRKAAGKVAESPTGKPEGEAAGRPRRGTGKAVGRSLADYRRGVAGGLLFSLPLLYTMEVWWAGFLAGPLRLLALLAVTFVLLIGYNHFAGLRRDISFAATVGEAFEELGIGLVLSALVLWLTGRIDAGMGVAEVVGKTVVESAVVAIGVSVGKAQLGSGGGRRHHADQGRQRTAPEPGFAGQLVIAACGAVLIAGNVAPTEEIVVIAAETAAGKIFGLLVLSLLVTAAVLYHADFRGAEQQVPRPAGPADMVGGTLVMYGVGLAVAAAQLWFFGRFEGVSPAVGVAQIVVLAFPAALGASAGRLLLQE
jgi:putative integral membrane protein (TIGR02587 family)